ncbi:MAG TPA: hypothetical protein VKA38_05005, partial [Draconibacterium sp.]|nr:hypothetical protein [Draconibacterium sp.]
MKSLIILFCVLITAQISYAQFQPNYDESKVPDFVVPNPLKTFSGKKIRNSKQWLKKRRPELLRFFTLNEYGKIPGELKIDSYKVLEQSDNALNGKAKRKQVDLTFKKNGRTLDFTILIYLPKNVEKAPLFVGYNFYGNHT